MGYEQVNFETLVVELKMAGVAFRKPDIPVPNSISISQMIEYEKHQMYTLMDRIAEQLTKLSQSNKADGDCQ